MASTAVAPLEHGTASITSSGVLVQILSYNTNLQGELGTPQDLVDWLSPALSTSNQALPATSPDIVAVGFQELLPLHLGLTGLTSSVLANRDTLIRSQIEAHAKDKATYSLVGKVCNVGVALLVYAKDEGIAKHVYGVQTQWTGCGPMYMGNKGAVGLRFRVKTEEEAASDEVFTFVSTHLTAHAHNLPRRLQDYNRIVRTLLFPSLSSSSGSHTEPEPSHTTLYHTSHLFLFGDLNFRLTPPASVTHDNIISKLQSEAGRREVAGWDELSREKLAGKVCYSLREAEFWRFPCTYKHKIGSISEYSAKRMPAWTDRILYTTYTDSDYTPSKSAITPLLYTSIPSYTTSDHKPITALLLVPYPSPHADAPSSTSSTTSLITRQTTPLLTISSSYILTPSRFWYITRLTGKSLDLFIGWIWYLLRTLGIGHAGVGIGNFVVGLGAVAWWRGFLGRV